MQGQEPTHGDILEKLGELKGQVATLIVLVGQKREDINALYSRVSLLEKTTASHEEMNKAETRIGAVERLLAKWAGICLAAALVMPIVLPRIQQGLGVVEQNAGQGLERFQ